MSAYPLPSIGRPLKYPRAKIAEGVRCVRAGESLVAVAHRLGITHSALSYHARGGKVARLAGALPAGIVRWMRVEVVLPAADTVVLIANNEDPDAATGYLSAGRWYYDAGNPVTEGRVFAWSHMPATPFPLPKP